MSRRSKTCKLSPASSRSPSRAFCASPPAAVNCIGVVIVSPSAWAAGFMEPLESTSIHLVTSGVYHLLEHFPDKHFDPVNIELYNRELIVECERVRDFIVLHYCLSKRDDAPFWQYCRSMAIPDTLRERIELYGATGRIRPLPGELFTDSSWFYIFEGSGVRPAAFDPLLEVVPKAKLREILTSMTDATAAAVRAAPTHDSYFEALN